MIIGKKIKELRQALGLSQVAFASGIKIPQSYLSAIEKGKKQLTLKLTNKICEVYGVAPSVLIDTNEKRVELLPHNLSQNKFLKGLSGIENDSKAVSTINYTELMQSIDVAEPLKTLLDKEGKLRERLNFITEYLDSNGLFKHFYYRLKLTQLSEKKTKHKRVNSTLKGVESDIISLRKLIDDLTLRIGEIMDVINKHNNNKLKKN